MRVMPVSTFRCAFAVVPSFFASSSSSNSISGWYTACDAPQRTASRTLSSHAPPGITIMSFTPACLSSRASSTIATANASATPESAGASFAAP